MKAFLALLALTASATLLAADAVPKEITIDSVDFYGNGCSSRTGVEIQPIYREVGHGLHEQIVVMYEGMTVMPYEERGPRGKGTGRSFASPDQSCTTRFTVSFPEGYRMVLQKAFREDDIRFEYPGVIQVESSYSFFGSKPISFSREYSGALQERHEQHAPLDGFDGLRSDCSGKAQFELANRMALVEYAAGKRDDDKDKDDISMAFVDEDEIDIVWEKCD